MKLRNKKTGIIVEFVGVSMYNGRLFYRLEDENGTFKIEVNSLAELNEEWEDYEEPKEHWYIDWDGELMSSTDKEGWGRAIAIGNYFESKEEANQAVEKLKAWKLLKDECNIKFDGIIRDDKAMLKGVKLIYDRHNVTFDKMRECVDALHLLFGVED